MPVKSTPKSTPTRNLSVPPQEPKSSILASAVKDRKRKAVELDSDSDSDDKPARKRNRRAQSAVPQILSLVDTKSRSSRTSFAQLAKNVQHTLLTPATHPRPSRRLFIFGSGEFGQLGLGTDCLNEISRPRLHAWFELAVQKGILGGEAAGLETAWAGGMHTLACDEEGKVWSFGINDNASLGRTTENVPDPANEGNMIEQEELETQPMLVQSLDDFRAVQVVSGDSVSVALSDTGHLRAWGSFRSSDGLLGFASDKKASKTQFKPIAIPGLEKHSFISVACGADHVMALTDAGQVFIWGNGEQAQLGRRIIQRRKLNALVPERLALRKINLIGSGSYHSFAQDASGIVYAWGLNTYRQTGVSNADGGEETIIWQPTEISALNPKRLGKGRRVMQISGGEHHTLFLLSDGSVFACGRADDGQVGLANDHPLMIEMAEQKTKRLKQLADHPGLDADAVDELVAEPTLVRFPPPPPSDGGVSQPAELPPYAETDEHMPPVNPISQLSAGTRHNLAVSRSGHVYSWGVGMTCQLGLGPVINHQPTPRRVADKVLDKYKVEHASAGGQHCILLATQVVEKAPA